MLAQSTSGPERFYSWPGPCKFVICLSVIAFVTKPLNFQPPQKVMQQFFLGYSGPHIGPTNTNHTKNYQKITFWALFRIPPQNALQCTTVQCNVLKCKRLNYSLQMGQIRPIMTQDDCVWQGMTYQGSGGFQGVQGGTRGRQGRLGYSRRQNE